MPPAAGPNVTVNLAALTNKCITEIYEHRMGLIVMMDEIRVASNERKKIFTNGFESCEELVNHFIDDVDGFKKYLEIVNKTSTNANTNLHFTPPAMRRFVGVVYCLNTVVNGMHNISDVLQITKEISEMYGD